LKSKTQIPKRDRVLCLKLLSCDLGPLLLLGPGEGNCTSVLPHVLCFGHISRVTGAILPNCPVFSDMRCYVWYWAHLWPCLAPGGLDEEETTKTQTGYEKYWKEWGKN